MNLRTVEAWGRTGKHQGGEVVRKDQGPRTGGEDLEIVAESREARGGAWRAKWGLTGHKLPDYNQESWPELWLLWAKQC